MIQDIITFCIITGVVSYSLIGLYNLLVPDKKSGDCPAGCTGCNLKNHIVVDMNAGNKMK
jgi:hypothetical protein